jgi:hypothetical protein
LQITKEKASSTVVFAAILTSEEKYFGIFVPDKLIFVEQSFQNKKL